MVVIEGLSRARKFKSNVGIKGAEKKLVTWLRDFEFVDIRTAVESKTGDPNDLGITMISYKFESR